MTPNSLSPEFFWLTLTVILTGLMWVPYILNRLTEQSPLFVLRDPQGKTHTEVRWAERMMRAHQNAVENLVLFAPLVIMLQLNHLTNGLTATACMVYFYARLAHFLVFSVGLPWLRIPVFAVAFTALVVLALRLLQWV